jgi:hypothetical protein
MATRPGVGTRCSGGFEMICSRKPRQNIVYFSAERSRPCSTYVTRRIYTYWLCRFEGPLLCLIWL